MRAEQRIEILENRIKLLEDHLQITQLVAAYGPAVDSGSLTLVATLIGVPASSLTVSVLS